MLATVHASLSSSSADVAAPLANGLGHTDGSGSGAVESSMEYPAEEYIEEDAAWVYNVSEMVFDDTGEGAGVEGDLDMDDD